MAENQTPMDSSSPPKLRLLRAWRGWWSDTAARDGRMAAARQLLVALWEFVRESTPEQERRRYGDADYDWDYRVNTTSAAVGWRDRLIGILHSGYQPTEPAAFHDMLVALRRTTRLD